MLHVVVQIAMLFIEVQRSLDAMTLSVRSLGYHVYETHVIGEITRKTASRLKE